MIQELVDKAVRTAAAVADVLRALEPTPTATGDDYVALAARAWQGPVGERKRAARVVASTWRREVRRSSAHRPDVLRLTCDLLADPTVPFTRDVARYAVTLGLRSAYGIEYSTEALAALRTAHSSLEQRFEKQVRKRIRKNRELESFIIDIACMDGATSRSLTHKNLASYYRGFTSSGFGVVPAKGRRFSPSQAWPELNGTLPDFATIVKLAFAQPTSIAGLDDIVDGLLPAVPDSSQDSFPGGLVTLVAGPPGSGKTSLCLTLGSRMAELGSHVTYLATEEAPEALEAKLVSVVDPGFLATSLLNRGAASRKRRLRFIDGRNLVDFEEVVNALAAEFSGLGPTSRRKMEDGLYLVFPRALVIDSLTALIHARNADVELQTRRQRLAGLFAALRNLGICVFLVGGPHDCEDEGLAYLVDNVFALGVEDVSGHQHKIRTFTVHKTRLQASARGRHVMHLSRTDGCVVNPSLHSINRNLRPRTLEPDALRKGLAPRSRLLSKRASTVRLRPGAQTLIYGRGSAAKARFAIACAFDPGERSFALRHRPISQRRVLVVSFLYDGSYYESIVHDLLRARLQPEPADITKLVTIHALYPGFLDPETLVARVVRELRSGALDGVPYSAVVIDGIHNLLMQFPLLETEALLWPTLYRLFRAQGLDAVSTFTFFSIPTVDGPAEQSMITGSQQIFFHLLVGNCDYSFVVERTAEMEDPSWVWVRLASSAEPFDPRTSRFAWDPKTFKGAS